MDTVVGPQGKSKKVMLVLTERKTRKEIVYLMQDRKAQTVVKALNTIERSYGERLFRNVFKTITVDNGVEFSDADLCVNCNKLMARYRKYIIAIHIAVVREVLMKTLTVSSVGTFRKELILIRKGNLKPRK